MRDFKLYFIADIKPGMAHSPTDLITQAAAGWVDIVQLRYKPVPGSPCESREQGGASTRELLELGQEIKPLLQAKSVPLIINDRVDVALALDAAGVHLGQGDMPVKIARRILGQDKIIGLSTHSLEQALAAQASGADYLAIGAIFSTNTKQMPTPPLGTEILQELAQQIHIPWLAIGGINQSNLSGVIQAGARRIAVASAIADAVNITEASQELKTCLIHQATTKPNGFLLSQE